MKFLATTRSRARVIALALLPALLLRALTPVGFMPMHDAHGGLYLAFCPGIGDTLVPPSVDDPRHDHDHHPGHAIHDHGGGQSAPQHHEVCPYALSAGPALAYSVPGVPALAPLTADAPAPDYSSISIPSIERAQSARAPPAPRIA
jgi:hypothetical protein